MCFILILFCCISVRFMYLNDEDTWAEKEFGGLRTSLHRKKNRTIAEFQCFSACFMIKVHLGT